MSEAKQAVAMPLSFSHLPTLFLTHFQTYLGMVPADLDQQLVDELAHGGVVGVDAGDDLQ